MLAGVLACLRQTGKTAQDLKDQRIVMCGAGSAGVGVSTVIKDAMRAAGLSEEEARSRFYVLEKEGLLAKQGMSSEDYDALARGLRGVEEQHYPLLPITTPLLTSRRPEAREIPC